MIGQQTARRTIEAYDPAADAAERWPGWTIRAVRLYGLGEIADVPSRTILIDPETEGERYAIAHALAHLDLDHLPEDGGGVLTDEEESDADWLARLRLDDPDAPSLRPRR